MSEELSDSAAMIVVAAFYKFVPLPGFAEMREPLRTLCDEHGIRGTILLAPEGVNGTIAGLREGINAVLAYLKADDHFADLEHKESFTETPPFRRMKVRLKREIMGLGAPGTHAIGQVGQYVDPEDWNALIDDPDVLVIDARNEYEVAVGAFDRAVNPNTRTFRQFPDFVAENLDPRQHTKIAMYCTGGIRCEKASSFLLSQNFAEVYHLKGGILKYLETVSPEESRWHGECFVFDERVAVDHALQPGTHTKCLGCGDAVSQAGRESELSEEGIVCPRCAQRAG